MTAREEKFCCYYAMNGNAKYSATMSGYKISPEKNAVHLLMREDIRRKVREYRNRCFDNLKSMATAGYAHLAFGNIADCVRLIYSENLDTLALDTMDLYMISEIKKPKDGSMEIKFFDRLKALEKLTEINQMSEENSIPFYKALEKSADLFNGIEGDNDVPD